jgi:hypothetical protein
MAVSRPTRRPSRPALTRISEPTRRSNPRQDIDVEIRAVWRACYEGRLSWIEAARRDEALRLLRDGRAPA